MPGRTFGPPGDLAAPERVRFAVVGGGIVGLAVARALQRRVEGAAVALLEAEDGLCRHQTGHNSGVIHSGLYYRPGSRKARLAVSGALRMRRFCIDHDIEHRVCGKVVVATDEVEEGRLQALLERGLRNGVPGLERVGPERLSELQPGVRGRSALWVPGVTITDFAAVGRRLADEIRAGGGQVRTGARVTRALREGSGWVLEGPFGSIRADYLVGCAGGGSDRLARASGERPAMRIVPFRGEYRVLAPDRAAGVGRLVYPTPDPGLPFLGVHLTPRLDGRVEVGPNAVLSWSRTGRRRGSVSLRDAWDTLTWPGFWRMAARHVRVGVGEQVRSWIPSMMARDLGRMLPGVGPGELLPGGAGVRAQAVGRDGSLLDDFAWVQGASSLHVLNAPSPAATAALAIGEVVAARAAPEP